MAVGDADSYPDIDLFTTGVREELQRLIVGREKPVGTSAYELPN
jgi:hypothetical protein